MKINKEQLRKTLRARYKSSENDHFTWLESKPTSKPEYKAALELLESLPETIHQPSITVDFDGTFEFTWLGTNSVFIFRDEGKHVLMYKAADWVTQDFNLKKGFPAEVLEKIKI